MYILKDLKKLYRVVRKGEKKDNFCTPQNPDILIKDRDLLLNDENIDKKRWFKSLTKVVKLSDSTSNKSFISQLFAGREDSATLAELIASIINTSMYNYKVSGVHSVVEKIVIDKLLSVFGLEQGEGIFNPGGSISNLTAMMVARNLTFPQVKESGVFGIKTPVIYTSKASHYSITKNGNILGLGRDSICEIPCDSQGKMDVKKLLDKVLSDKKEGKNPFMVIATAGTTVLGTFDNIEEISTIAKEEKLWLHVDGSYGLGVVFSPKRKHLIKGIQNADSLSFNPHKMLGVPQQCSVAIFSKKGVLEKTLSENAPYLFQSQNNYDLGQKSILCARKNDAIKLWSLWKYYGDKGLEERVEKQFLSAQNLRDLIKEDNNLILEFEPEFLNVCFNHKNKNAIDICQKLYEKGSAKLSYGNYDDKTFMRYTCLNPYFTKQDHIDIINKIHGVVD